MKYIFVLLLFTRIVFSNENYQENFPKKINSDIYSQITAYDLDKDGKKELIFGSLDGRIHIFNSNGEEWNTGLWPHHTSDSILSKVSIIEQPGKENPLIIAASYNGIVTAVDIYGKEKFKKDTHGIITSSSITTGDADNDGNLDIIVGNSNGKVSVIDNYGNTSFSVNGTSSISSKIYVADLDDDGKNELIFKDDKGKIYVTEKNKIKKGWPKKNSNSNLSCSYDIKIADIDNDGYKDIISTTNKEKGKYWLTVFNNDGKQKIKFPLPEKVYNAPAIGDIDKDGKLDFVLTMKDGKVTIMDQSGKNFKNWPKKICKHIEGSPKLVDINNDGILDIIITGYNDGDNEKTGFVTALDINGNIINGYPKYVGQIISSVTIADIDNDKDMEIIAAGGINNTGKQLIVFDEETIPHHLEIIVMGTEFEY